MSDQTPDPAGAPTASSAPPAPPLDESVYRRRRMLGIVALAAIGIGVIVFAIFGARAFNSRMDAARKIDQATVLLQDADKIVVEVDEVVRAKVAPELAEKARGAEQRVSAAEGLLAKSLELIDEAYPDLNDDEREKAVLLRNTVVARRKMLEPAPAVLKLNAEASSAIPLAEAAWKDVLAADDLSDKAVTSYNKLTKAGVTESQKLNRQASSKLATARDGFDAAEKAFSAAPFEQYLAYADARIDLNELSQQSDAAWLKNDLAKANAVITDYNEQDRKAVALAKQLPANPEAAIAKAFEDSSRVQTDAYFAARDAALKAQQELEEY